MIAITSDLASQDSQGDRWRSPVLVHQPKKYGRYVVLAIAILFAFKNPEAAAHIVRNGSDLLMQAADAAGEFTDALQS